MGIITKDRPRPDSGARTCKPAFRPKWPTQTPFIPALPTDEIAHLIGQLAPAEVRALHFIAEHADTLTIDGKTWLLTPAPAMLLDTLAAVGAVAEDVEPECEDEGAQCEDDGAMETALGADDHGEREGWVNPTWPADGEIKVSYHAL